MGIFIYFRNARDKINRHHVHTNFLLGFICCMQLFGAIIWFTFHCIGSWNYWHFACHIASTTKQVSF